MTSPDGRAISATCAACGAVDTGHRLAGEHWVAWPSMPIPSPWGLGGEGAAGSGCCAQQATWQKASEGRVRPPLRVPVPSTVSMGSSPPFRVHRAPKVLGWVLGNPGAWKGLDIFLGRAICSDSPMSTPEEALRHAQ